MAKEVKNIDSLKGQQKKFNKPTEGGKPSKAGKYSPAGEPVLKFTGQDARSIGQDAKPAVQDMKSGNMAQGSFKMNQPIKKVNDESKSVKNIAPAKKPDSQKISHLMLDGPDSYIDYEKLIRDGKRPLRKKAVE